MTETERLNNDYSVEAESPLNKNHSRLILVGRAASGKDFARQKLQGRGYTYGVSYTTRPPRSGEIDGKDYYFLTKEAFTEMIKNDEFYEYVEFNGWIYGTTKKQFYTNDIFIMTPKGISHLSPEDRAKSFIIYFDIPLSIRRERLMQRSDADKVERRIEADEYDFKDFQEYDMHVTNNNF